MKIAIFLLYILLYSDIIIYINAKYAIIGKRANVSASKQG